MEGLYIDKWLYVIIPNQVVFMVEVYFCKFKLSVHSLECLDSQF